MCTEKKASSESKCREDGREHIDADFDPSLICYVEKGKSIDCELKIIITLILLTLE
jgi:hypothetical protein